MALAKRHVGTAIHNFPVVHTTSQKNVLSLTDFIVAGEN
jgi:hypothetical protein